ncbi:hypothetical protein EVAR_69703_1, partial [Eumeta japonica]
MVEISASPCRQLSKPLSVTRCTLLTPALCRCLSSVARLYAYKYWAAPTVKRSHSTLTRSHRQSCGHVVRRREITARFQTARSEVRQLLLQYLLPWLVNIELVDPNVPPANPLSYIQ